MKKRRWEGGNSGGSLPLGGGRPGLPDGSVFSMPYTTGPGVTLASAISVVHSLVIVQLPELQARARGLFADSQGMLTDKVGWIRSLMLRMLFNRLKMYLGLTIP